MIAITNDPIEVSELISKLGQEGAGSVVVHMGVVKSDPDGRESSGVSFEPTADTESELARLTDNVREKFDVIDAVLVRRMGSLGIGDVIMFAAAAAKGREEAFAACRELVESCKKMKAINKTEHYKD